MPKSRARVKTKKNKPESNQATEAQKEKRIKELLQKISETKELLDREKSKTDYSVYVDYVHQGSYKHAKHTRLICEKLQKVEAGEIDRLMIFMPPRHSKSETVTKTFPSWFIGRNPNREVIEVSYGDDLAVEFGMLNKQKVEQFGKLLFNIEIARGKEAKASWGIKGHSGNMESVGIGGSITGRGADLLIIDDPHKNSEEAESATIREKIWNEYQKTLLTRLHPGAAIILIMTRWHHDDLAGRILREEGQDSWEVIDIPCEAEKNDPLGRKPGEPLWPERGFDKTWMEKHKRRVGSRTWNALYQQKPTPDEGGLINVSKFKYYKVKPDINNLDMVLQSWDMTFKDTDGTDYVVGQVWGAKENRLYLLGQKRARMDFPTTLQEVQNMTTKWPMASPILIEDKANGPAVISSLQYKLGGIQAITPKGSKQARVSAVSTLIDNGYVYLPMEPWVDVFVEECKMFPNGLNDDQVDAMSQALEPFLYLTNYEPPKEEDRIIYDFDADIDRRNEFEDNWFD